jgi:hypothetical protein
VLPSVVGDQREPERVTMVNAGSGQFQFAGIGRRGVVLRGLYRYRQGQVRLYPYERANSDNTLAVLETLRQELPSGRVDRPNRALVNVTPMPSPPTLDKDSAILYRATI